MRDSVGRDFDVFWFSARLLPIFKLLTKINHRLFNFGVLDQTHDPPVEAPKLLPLGFNCDHKG